MKTRVVTETNLPELALAGRGKVRDVYDLGDRLLIVSTDRISAFDVILQDPIPDKGRVLNKLSVFWLEKTRELVPNHLISADVADFPDECRPFAGDLEGRTMMVRKARPFPVECVVRGYLIGSGWKDYRNTGAICGIRLPEGLKLAEKLPEPIFTPSTKAEIGDHDENISFKRVQDLVGTEMANRLRDKTIELYLYGSKWAEDRGIIIADTKFEFGVLDGEPILIDEVLTPDSSRFWPRDRYGVGMSPPSLDKQFVRDFLEGLDWDKKPPSPRLPEDVIAKTRAKYLELYSIITGDRPG
ncbi:MAG: phosphoribosylaminoimidazolesuccinocarboxamide synthase [Thermodesulfobacteriota bacterium]